MDGALEAIEDVRHTMLHHGKPMLGVVSARLAPFPRCVVVRGEAPFQNVLVFQEPACGPGGRIAGGE
jgi:hypothetical protein